MRILITGATGYVGGQLLPRLVEAGHEVTCMVRNVSRLSGGLEGARIVEGDALRPDSLPPVLRGIEVAYYLIHSMGGGQAGFEERDRRAARNFASAARQAGVQRIIYLGGLTSESSPVSLHLKSRQETGAVLREFGPALTEFRAGIIVGNGSISFEIIRCLTERLPVMICPRWVMTRTQPIAISDLLGYLVAALDVPESIDQIVEIGGASIETYRSMMLTYAQIRGLKRWLLRVPVLTPRLSSYWLNLVTPFPAAITRPLIEGLKTEVVCGSSHAAELFPEIIPMRYRAAVAVAVGEGGPDKTVLQMIPRGESHVSLRRQGYICDVRQTSIHAPATQVFAVLQGLGGKSGWLYGNLLWQMRGWLDHLLGGVGMSRSRTGGAQLQAGDCVDFWRVEEVVPGEEISLRAEMKLPGRAWLQFILLAESRERTLLRCCAWFKPRGLAGELYWGLLYPIHVLIFRGFVRAIARKSESSFQSTAQAFQGS
ncbi:MAG: SDR family oxidoreductase [Terriglobales bacterium]